MSQSLDTEITEDDRLHQIARHIPGVIYQFRMRPDGSFHFPYASDGLLEVHGVYPAEVFEDASKVFSVIHPEDIDRFTQSILESAANMTPWYYEYRVNLLNGKQLWLLGHSTPQREADGSTLWHGYIRDITESKTTEIALQANENKFRSIIENLNDMVYVINADASFSYVSLQFQEVMGYEIGELLNDSFAKLVHPEDLSICVDALHRSFQGEKVRGVEYRVLHKDGNYYWHSSNVSALRNDDGEVVACLGVARYIHNRKQAEITLEENHIRLELALRVANIGSWDWNPQTNQVAFSAQWKAILGYADHEIENSLQEWESRVHPEDLPFVYENIGRHIQGETQFYQTEHRLLSKDGTYKWIVDRGQITERDEQGNPVRFIGINFDITDRKAAEEALQASEEKMRSFFDLCPLGILLNDIQGRFLETNGAMQSIVGYSLEELNQLSYWDLTPEKYAQDEARQLASLNTLGYCGPYQKEYIRKDGSLVPVELRGVLITARDGRQYISSVITDISDRKQAQKEQSRLLAILEATSDFVGSADPSGNVLYLNRSARQMLGLTPTDDISQRSLTESHPEWANQLIFSEGLPETGRSGSWLGETAILKADGNEIPVSQLIVAHRSEESGEIEYFSTIARDISEQQAALRERQAAEAALKISERNLRTIFDNSNNAIFIHDLDTTVLDVNNRMLEMFGMESQEQAIVLSILDYSAPDTSDNSLEQVPVFWAQALAGETVRFAWKCQRPKDGSCFDTEITINKITLDEKEVMLSSVQDISEQQAALRERKAAEAALAESEAQNRAILQSIPDIMFRVNESGIYLGYSTSATLLDLGNKEPIGKFMGDYLSLEHYQRHKHHMDIVLETRQTQIYEQEVEVAGHIQYEEVRIVPIEGKQELLFMIRDINDRKQAEAVLSEYADRQTLLNQLVHQIRNSLDLDTVIATTIQSIRHLLDIDVCSFVWYKPDHTPPNWEVIQEAKPQDFPSRLGLFPADLIGPVDQLIFNQEILRIDDVADYAEPIHRNFLQTIECQSEVLLPIQTHSNRVGAIICLHYTQVRPWTDGEIELLKAVSDQLAIAINQAELYAESRSKSQELQNTLQELQRTQTQMIQSEKMSSLGQLVGGIAHEVNNPVSFIYGNIQPATDYVEELVDLVHLYQEQYPDPPQIIVERLEEINLEYLIHDFSRLLESMKNGATRIRDIIKSLRTFSRLDEEGCKAIDIHENIDSTLMVLQSRFNGRDGKPEIQLIKDYGDLPWIECYGGLLNQVFVNLLMNAIDSIESRTANNAILLHNANVIEQKREILKSTQNPKYHGVITITTALTPTNQVIISIQDNGCGMDAQVQEKIFNPFFTTKPIGQGTGMGLAISYQIMTESHQGNISVNSTPGKGTEFVITLPIKQANSVPINF